MSKSVNFLMISIFFSLCFSHTTVAIDIGTESFKARTVENGRETKSIDYPAYFAIWNLTNPNYTKTENWTIDDLNESDWEFFNNAKKIMNENPDAVIRGFNPLNGFSRGISNKIVFTALLKEIYSQQGAYHPRNPLIFTVPSSMDRTDRYILQECADLLSLNLVAIIDQHTAMASKFLEVNKTTFQEKERNVMFIDIGAKKTWYTVFNFFSEEENTTKYNAAEDQYYNETRYIPYGQQLTLETVDAGGDLLNQQFFDKIEQSDIDHVGNQSYYLLSAQEMKRLYRLNRTLVYHSPGSLINVTMDPSEISIDSLVPTFSKIVGVAKQYEVDLIIITGGTSQFPLVKQYFQSPDIAINVSFIPNGMTTQSTAINDGRIRGIHAFANCDTSLEYFENDKNSEDEAPSNINILKITSQTSLTNETVTLNITAAEALKTSFKIMEGENVLTQFKIDVPNVTPPEAIIELTFGIDVYTVPNILSARYEGYPLDIYPERPPWMLKESEFEDATEFINALDIVRKDRVRFAKTNKERKQKLMEFLKSSHKFNMSAFESSNLTSDEFLERIQKKFAEQREKAKKALNDYEKENPNETLKIYANDQKKDGKNVDL